ncbi:MAG: hypothetical protein M3N08_09020 [Pseudomonadota bacterium]|nr:hypothetical protein [Pseudomonadota bacterium]
MIVELSPTAYVALCGLVQDALQHQSDATALLKRVARELAGATANDSVPAEAIEHTEQAAILRRAGFAG